MCTAFLDKHQETSSAFQHGALQHFTDFWALSASTAKRD